MLQSRLNRRLFLSFVIGLHTDGVKWEVVYLLEKRIVVG
jgi:hypothetical protein